MKEMTIAVRDNKTNKVIAKANTNEWSKMYVVYVDGYRRKYTDATVEIYYTEEIKGNPVSKYNTFC